MSLVASHRSEFYGRLREAFMDYKTVRETSKEPDLLKKHFVELAR